MREITHLLNGRNLRGVFNFQALVNTVTQTTFRTNSACKSWDKQGNSSRGKCIVLGQDIKLLMRTEQPTQRLTWQTWGIVWMCLIMRTHWFRQRRTPRLRNSPRRQIDLRCLMTPLDFQDQVDIVQKQNLWTRASFSKIVDRRLLGGRLLIFWTSNTTGESKVRFQDLALIQVSQNSIKCWHEIYSNKSMM